MTAFSFCFLLWAGIQLKIVDNTVAILRLNLFMFSSCISQMYLCLVFCFSSIFQLNFKWRLNNKRAYIVATINKPRLSTRYGTQCGVSYASSICTMLQMLSWSIFYSGDFAEKFECFTFQSVPALLVNGENDGERERKKKQKLKIHCTIST